jgi:hypothetical protein
LKHKICLIQVTAASSVWGRPLSEVLLGENNMRQISIVIAAALFGVIAALLGATNMTAHAPQQAEVAAASSSIDIAGMKRDSKLLPVEQFDAH